MHKIKRLAMATLFISCGFIWACFSEATAHALQIFVTTEGEKLHGYVYFGGGKKPQSGLEITVRDDAGNDLATIETNEFGEFYYTPTADTPFDGPLHFNVASLDGHGASTTVGATSLPAGSTSQAQAQAHGPAPSPDTELIQPTTPPSLHRTEEEYLIPLIDKVVTQRTAMLQKQLAEMLQERRLMDVIGGLGYILGLFGLAFYLMGRKAKTRS